MLGMLELLRDMHNNKIPVSVGEGGKGKRGNWYRWFLFKPTIVVDWQDCPDNKKN